MMFASHQWTQLNSNSALSIYDSSSSENTESNAPRDLRIDSATMRRSQETELEGQPLRKRVRFIDGGIPGGTKQPNNDKTSSTVHSITEENGKRETFISNHEETGESISLNASIGFTDNSKRLGNHIEARSLKEGPKVLRDEEDVEAELERFERSIAEDEEAKEAEELWSELEEKREEEVQRQLVKRVAQLRQQAQLPLRPKTESLSVPHDFDLVSSLLEHFNDNGETRVIEEKLIADDTDMT